MCYQDQHVLWLKLAQFSMQFVLVVYEREWELLYAEMGAREWESRTYSCSPVVTAGALVLK